MSPEFVHYAPDIETVDPNLDEVLAQIIEFWEGKARVSPKTEGAGRALRGAHAKSFGLVKAEVEILADVSAAYAQGVYAKPGRHDALIRFSSTSGHLGPDAQLGAGLGFAIKLFDVDGRKLVDEEPDTSTFDLVLKNTPVFIANTARHYLFIEDIAGHLTDYLARGRAGFHELLTDFLTGKGTLAPSDWAWDELLAFLTAVQVPARNPLLTTFWSMGAVRHGDYVAKFRIAPAADSAAHVVHREVDLTAGPEVFRPVLIDELRASPFDFDLQVQLCTDLDTMPVNLVTQEWPEKLSPFVTVARIHLPRQDISGPENVDKGDALAFNQWRVTSEHRPLGEIMNVRRIYSASAKVRRTLNGQPQTEPVSADSVLP
ncbi:catalase family protein [Catellatospora tritici]|uniref:catalase family protein n=1 Tax=Catellatospora tritici TaxID=2851566 RepID=UPI001C2CD7CE|nr:catalase family protein [Catellatospora tritici]MBV1854362.1 catalase family protein [Catellatospora tritici]